MVGGCAKGAVTVGGDEGRDGVGNETKVYGVVDGRCWELSCICVSTLVAAIQSMEQGRNGRRQRGVMDMSS